MNSRAREQLHRHRTLQEIVIKDGHRKRIANSQNRQSQRIAIMPACYCTYFNCKGQLVDDKTRKRHERMDVSEKFHCDGKVCQYIEFAQYLKFMPV